MSTGSIISILENKEASYRELVDAAADLCSKDRPNYDALMACISLGGLPAELATMKLDSMKQLDSVQRVSGQFSEATSPLDNDDRRHG